MLWMDLLQTPVNRGKQSVKVSGWKGISGGTGGTGDLQKLVSAVIQLQETWLMKNPEERCILCQTGTIVGTPWSVLRPRGITSQGGIVHYNSPAFMARTYFK